MKKETKAYLIILAVSLAVSIALSLIMINFIAASHNALFREKCTEKGGEYVYLEKENCPVKSTIDSFHASCFNYYCELPNGKQLNLFEFFEGFESLVEHNYNMVPSGAYTTS